MVSTNDSMLDGCTASLGCGDEASIALAIIGGTTELVLACLTRQNDVAGCILCAGIIA